MNARPWLPALLLSAFLLAACGNKGDLFHPPPPEDEDEQIDGLDDDVPEEPWPGDQDEAWPSDAAEPAEPVPMPAQLPPPLPVPVPPVPDDDE